MFKTFMKYFIFAILTIPLANLLAFEEIEFNTLHWWSSSAIFVLYATPVLVVLNKLFEKGEK